MAAGTPGPVAIPTAAATPPAAPERDYLIGKDVAPPQLTGALPSDYDPALAGFAKIQAELRADQDSEIPLALPFGREGTMRFYSQMTAEWAILAAESQSSPGEAFKMLRSAIYADDRAKYDEMVRRQEEHGLTAKYIVQCLEHLMAFYSGNPTDAS